MGDLGEPGAGVEDPGADGDEVEHADDVVGRRVIRALLVAVVEAVELRGDDPGGEADDEEDEELGDVGPNCGRTRPPAAICVTTNAAISPMMSAQSSARRTSHPRLWRRDGDSCVAAGTLSRVTVGCWARSTAPR